MKLSVVTQQKERKTKMEDNFDYRELLGELDDIDELIESLENEIEEVNLTSWTLVFRNDNFAIFADYQGETRIVNANYINKSFLASE